MKLNKLLMIGLLPILITSCSVRRSDSFTNSNKTFDEVFEYYNTNKDEVNPEQYSIYFTTTVHILNAWNYEGNFTVRITNEQQTLAFFEDPILLPSNSFINYEEHERICIKDNYPYGNQITNIDDYIGSTLEVKIARVYKATFKEDGTIDKYGSTCYAIEVTNN